MFTARSIIMNIRNKLIKLLGGYTESELNSQKTVQKHNVQYYIEAEKRDIVPIHSEIRIDPYCNKDIDIEAIKEQLAVLMIPDILNNINLQHYYEPIQHAVCYRGTLCILD